MSEASGVTRGRENSLYPQMSRQSSSSVGCQPLPLPNKPSPPANCGYPSSQSIPQGSLLEGFAEIANVWSLVFVGKDSSELAKSFALYTPKAGVLATAGEMLKAAGRGGALVLGSVLVGASRAIALGGSAFIGALLTMATLASVVGLLWMLIDPRSTETLMNAAKFLGSAASAIPAFVGAYCQHFAFQKPGATETMSTQKLFDTTLSQHFGEKDSPVAVAGVGAFVGVGAGMILAILLRTVAGMK